MKVLFVGDSPTVSTGFARCTRVACDALHSAGHEVTVLGMAYYGDPHNYPYPIYPCYAPLDNAHSYGGESRLPSMIARTRPDIIVILQDPWNLPRYFECLDLVSEQCKTREIEFNIPPVVGWLAVDSKNQKGEQLERLSHIMVWTEFAKKEFEAAIHEQIKDLDRAAMRARQDDHNTNLKALAYINKARDSVYSGGFDVVPLGVDADLFYPRDKKESRLELGFDQLEIPLDAFIVGAVGRNQSRKRLELTLDYFSSWMHRYDIKDAYLYLHVAPTGENSCDLKSLVKFFDLGGKVIVHTPDVGVGDDDSRMPFVYSALDVYTTQSQAEGFGLPALEAMACGVECVLPDHSAFGIDGGWIKNYCAYRVPCSGLALTAPQGKNPYTVGAIADKEATIETLSWIYQHRRLSKNTNALSLAWELSWKNTGAVFVDSLERFMAKHETEIRNCELETANAKDCALCGKDALCVSDNVEALVCSSCFDATNGSGGF